MFIILARPVYPPRSGRPTRSGPVWQDIFFHSVGEARLQAGTLCVGGDGLIDLERQSKRCAAIFG